MGAFFEITDENIAYVRNFYDVTEESVNRDIDVLKQWLKTKKFLPPIDDDQLLENMLLRSKFRIEVAKKRIENYLNSKLTLSRYIKPCHLVPSQEPVGFIPYLKLTPKHERIFVVKLLNINPEALDLVKTLNAIAATGEVLVRKDYFASNRVIIDTSNIGIGHCKKLSPTIMYHAQSLFLEAYSARIKGFHVVNASAIIKYVLAIVKTIIRTKLFKKIIVHKSHEELKEYIPEDFIPAEYGGTAVQTEEEVLDFMDSYFSKNEHQINEWLSLKAITKQDLKETTNIEQDITQLNID